MSWDEKFSIYSWVTVLAFVGGFVVGRWLHPDIDNALRTYQTLITGGLAVVAAFYVYGAVNRQIKEARVQAETDRKQAIIQDNRRIARSIHAYADRLGNLTSDLGVILEVFNGWQRGDKSYVKAVSTKYANMTGLENPPDAFLASWEISYICGLTSTLSGAATTYKDAIISAMEVTNEIHPTTRERVLNTAKDLKNLRIKLTVSHDYLMQYARKIRTSHSHAPKPNVLTGANIKVIARRTNSTVDEVRITVVDWLGEFLILENPTNDVDTKQIRG